MVYMIKENKNEITNKEETNIDEKTDTTDASKNTEERKVDNQRIPYERFKEKVDEVNELKKKLAEIEKAQKEKERKELEEQNEYKKLYEQAVQEAEKAKQNALNTKKSALLAQAGYDDDQAKALVKLVEGEDDESIKESIKKLQALFPAQDNFADPSAFNGEREKPKTRGADEVGAELFERIKNKIF